MICEKIKDWMKEIDSELYDCIAVCGIDGNKEKFVGIYPDNGGTKERICIGHTQTYQDYHFTILVHWTKSATAAYEKANEIRKKLSEIRNTNMSGQTALFCVPCKEPIPNGVDVHGIREFFIKATIYMELKKEG